MTSEPNPYDSPHEPSQATQPPKPKRWKRWGSLGLLLGAIVAGLGVHFYVSMMRMPFDRGGNPGPPLEYRFPERELPSALEGAVDERPSESL